MAVSQNEAFPSRSLHPEGTLIKPEDTFSTRQSSVIYQTELYKPEGTLINPGLQF